MMKYFILLVVYIALVNGSMKDDLKDKATEALNQGEKVKVCMSMIRWIYFRVISKEWSMW